MKKYFSPLLLLIAAIIWGFAFVAQKAAAVMPTFSLLFSRSVIAVLALIPAIILLDKFSKSGRKLFSLKEKKIDITKRELISGMICGGLLFLASALQQAGIENTDAGKTSFITALYVVIVPVYALLFGKKSPINAWVGIAVAVVGFYLLCIKDGFSIAPSDLLVFLCAFVFAMQIMAVDLSLPKCDGVRLSLVQFATMTVLSLLAAVVFEPLPSFSLIVSVMPEILFLGVASSGIAYTLQIIGQKNTPPALASILLSLESVFGAIFSAIVLSERMSAREYIGCAVVLLAVIISQLDFSEFLGKRASNKPSQKK
ncbi:MAG: DMT family transporter [Clostridia bacterium]|nr:DMT family transporter [Clostridia bacterium]